MRFIFLANLLVASYTVYIVARVHNKNISISYVATLGCSYSLQYMYLRPLRHPIPPSEMYDTSTNLHALMHIAELFQQQGEY